MVSKNTTNKVRIKIQNLSSTKTLATANLSITSQKKKKEKRAKVILNILKYTKLKIKNNKF